MQSSPRSWLWLFGVRILLLEVWTVIFFGTQILSDFEKKSSLHCNNVFLVKNVQNFNWTKNTFNFYRAPRCPLPVTYAPASPGGVVGWRDVSLWGDVGDVDHHHCNWLQIGKAKWFSSVGMFVDSSGQETELSPLDSAIFLLFRMFEMIYCISEMVTFMFYGSTCLKFKSKEYYE